ncbi:hypothetical protein MASR2M8_03170 [Opitutaceae bacterium]
MLHGTQPFVLRMVSGRAIEVPHPDFVAINAPQGLLVVTRDVSPTVEVIRLNQIESIETDDSAASEIALA